jgi:arylsulfatase A-like enzyme
MTRRSFLGGACGTFLASRQRARAAGAPLNIVVLLADDLGYGDAGCYGATRVRTPSIDLLAQRGIRFTDAHSSAATCTPSRYSLLTGEYAFRIPKAKVLPGDAPALIQPGRVTLPSILKQRGYRTAAIGKWHLGLGNGNLDWNGEIKPGPLEIGFDESFIIPATGDRVPCVYVNGHRVANLDPKDPLQVSYRGPLDDSPTGKTHPELLKMKPSHGHDMTIVNGISRIGYMRGGKSALWKDEAMADTLAGRAESFISRSAGQPFFLYLATHDIHVPRAPHDRFSNATSMGPRGNVIAELDWTVGKVMHALEQRGLLDNTLFLFSSDNGGVVDDGYRDEAVTRLGSHRPNGPLRGGKYSNFEGGTRIPLIVHWPARVKPGISDALVSQVDLLRSFAALESLDLPRDAGPDSMNLLPALLGESKAGRQLLVEQAGDLSLRDGQWKYISPGKGPKIQQNTHTEMGTDPGPQLYDLAADIGETRNLAAANQVRVAEMAESLRKIKAREALPAR